MSKELQQTKHNSATNSLLVITNTPLMYYPELRDVDVHESKDLSKEEKQVILASLNYPKIRNLNIVRGGSGENNSTEYDLLIDIISLSIFVMGITEKSMTEKEQELFIPVAIEEIKRFDSLTIEDVRIAFDKGSRRKYGDTFQMSIATINVWLTAYIEETKPTAMMRLPYIKKVEVRSVIEIIKEEGIILSNEEVKRRHDIWINGVYKKFEEFKVSGNYDFFDFGNKFYLYCRKLGIIKLNEKQQEDIWNRAVELLKKEYHPKEGRTFGQRIDMKSVYENLLKSPDEVDKKTEEIIIIRAKKLAIMYLFKRLIKDGKELKDVIEQAKSKLLNKDKDAGGKKITTDKKD